MSASTKNKASYAALFSDQASSHGLEHIRDGQHYRSSEPTPKGRKGPSTRQERFSTAPTAVFGRPRSDPVLTKWVGSYSKPSEVRLKSSVSSMVAASSPLWHGLPTVPQPGVVYSDRAVRARTTGTHLILTLNLSFIMRPNRLRRRQLLNRRRAEPVRRQASS